MARNEFNRVLMVAQDDEPWWYNLDVAMLNVKAVCSCYVVLTDTSKSAILDL